MRQRWLVVGLVWICACKYDPYRCTSEDQCVSGDVVGVCEPTGFCSFPDPDCESGKRYAAHGNGGLDGTCVDDVCGAVGAACCTDREAVCVDNAFCTEGNCTGCITDVALGRRFICRLKFDGTVWCSGINSEGQLGTGTASATASSMPVQVRESNGMPIDDATAIGAGRDHACAVRANGEVWCWGENEFGQLGNGVTIPTDPMLPPPAPVPWAVQVITTSDSPLTGAASVTGGDGFTCALLHSGGVRCWGENGSGQLGDGNTLPRSKAGAVQNAAGVAELSLGKDHACGRTTTNNILCWGDGGSGELFDSATNDRTAAIMVANSPSVSAGAWYTCIVGPDTTITCAGWNGHGRLGLGYGESYEDGDHVVPVQVLSSLGGAPFTGAASVAAGGVTCATMLDGTAYCWGDGTYGSTGTGTGSTVPLRVTYADGTPLRGVARIITHYNRACAITKRGDVLCWGRNLQGELADGTFLNRGFVGPLTLGCP